MSGKAAAFGGRMMNSVADQILKQFAANFASQVGTLAAQRSAAAPLPVPPPVVHELNALGLIWAMFKDWLRSLFSNKNA
jgi:hypothetical protein